MIWTSRAAWVVILGLLVVAPAFGWSKAGHRVVAVIAFRELLASSPGVIEIIVDIMDAHPSASAFRERMREEGENRIVQRERLFAEIAQWPDEVRTGPMKSYHHGTWHTIDIPYVPDGAKLQMIPVEAPRENIIWAFRENVQIFLARSSTKTQRAIALCWIFHLAGDGHQPLHTTALFNETYPQGDRHGGRFWVREKADRDAINLHYFWDGLVLRSQKMDDVRRYADRLVAAHPFATFDQIRQRSFKSADSFEAWVREESHRLAISDAYEAGRLSGGVARENAPLLPESYVKNAKAVGARQLTLSGYRLAEILAVIMTPVSGR